MSASEWPGRVLRSVLLSIEAAGHDAPGLMKELRLRPRSHSTWEDLVSLLEGFFSRHGIDATQRLVTELAGRDSSVRAVAELLGSPRLTYLVLFEAIRGRPGPVSLTWSAVNSGLQVRLELQPSFRASFVFFECCAWLLASIPRSRGMVDARVLPGQLSERELECVVIPPLGPELLVAHHEETARALATELFGPSDAAELEASSELSAQMLQSRFGFTRAEARVVCKLAEGLSIKGIAEALDVSFETARTHAKRAMQKTDTHRQAELVSLVLNGER